MTSPPSSNATRVIIVGGGTAGWMTAVALVGLLQADVCSVRLVESDEIGTVGVGEATLPQLRAFNRRIGLIEFEVMRRTRATFKLGIEFRGWGSGGTSYIHPFGAFGRALGGVDFHHQWRRAALLGEPSAIEDYSLSIAAARRGRFDFPVDDPARIESTFDYAYHLDAGLYGRYLREVGERRGVERTEGKVVRVDRDPETGALAAIALADGRTIEGDLFIDCSGFRALLIGDALKSGWEDWSRWLPCDRAFAVPSARTDDFHPYTRLTAREAGWQWRIPLQHRTGNGYVFSSRFLSEERAADTLIANLDGDAIDAPRLLKFATGRRHASWAANCVAIGLSSGFLEPLESTSIYLIQRGIEELVALFPSGPSCAPLRSEYNRRMDVEYERIRDFLILHYHANGRDEPLWQACREMAVPDSLRHKIELFARSGQIERYRDGLFSPPSWLSVLLGQGIVPANIHPMAPALPVERLRGVLDGMRAAVASAAEAMPSHASALEAYGVLAE